jgi:hypothetical protein
MIEWDTVFYSVPPDVVGDVVEVRQPVAEHLVEVQFAGRLVATHRLAVSGSEPQWLPEHRTRAEAIALGRKHLRSVTDDEAVAVPVAVGGLELGDGDYDVDAPDLAVYEPTGPHPTIDLPLDRRSPPT